MDELVVSPDVIETRKEERARRLAVRDIPALRVAGCTLICVGVFLNNQYILGDPSMLGFWISTVVAVVYCLVSWLALHAWYDKVPFDLSLFFLTVDVPLVTIAIYLSGAERSWLFFLLLMRVADQAVTTFRRCLGFVLFGAFCYAVMGVWVVYVDQRPIATEEFFSKLILNLMVGVYVALTARTAEKWRASRSEAIRMSRLLIRQIEEHSDELIEARGRAEEASAAKSEFLAHMSHEMRTPLHGVIGMLQLVTGDETSPRRLRQLEMAKRSAESLLATIEDILDFSKIEARRIELEPVYFSVRDLLSDTIKPLGVSAAAKNLILTAGIAADVPDSVWGDPLRLRQIIVNLTGNAIKFTDAGEVALRVSMLDEQKIRFEVRDTGIGIPEDQRHTIFEPFAQADKSHSRRHGGTGLGLAIVARLVDAMGGILRLESKRGEGTSVTIDLALPFDRFSVEPRRTRPELAGKSVVVVESNATSRGFLAEMLKAAGLKVHACATIQEIPAEKFACAVSADETIDLDPAVIIVQPLQAAAPDERIRIARPVVERELLDAIGTAVGMKPAEEPLQKVRERVARSGLHVLVAEDDAVSQEFAAEALKRMMHRVTVASDGEEALQALERGNFDIVFMDVQMPNLDGMEATRRYRERERGSRTPIVALTAHSRREDRMMCLEAGMDAVLTKPIDLKQLEDIVRSLTGAEPIVNAVGGNLKLLARVSDAFAKQTPVLLTQIRDAIRMNDSDALYQSAHKMKGAVSNFEGDPSLDLALMLESAARENDFPRAATLLRRLEPAIGALERRIHAACHVEN